MSSSKPCSTSHSASKTLESSSSCSSKTLDRTRSCRNFDPRSEPQPRPPPSPLPSPFSAVLHYLPPLPESFVSTVDDILVFRIMPKSLMVKEITGETVGESKVVTFVHQRKAEMARHSDAFIALPGGYGTLEEFLEVITWAQLGIHNKPVGLLNVDGYYSSLLDFIDKAVDDGFIQPFQRSIVISSPNAKEIVQKLEAQLF